MHYYFIYTYTCRFFFLPFALNEEIIFAYSFVRLLSLIHYHILFIFIKIHNNFDIYRAIGKQLAKLKNVQIVTGGFHGVGEVVGTAYAKQREENQQPVNIWHILPERDDQVLGIF